MSQFSVAIKRQKLKTEFLMNTSSVFWVQQTERKSEADLSELWILTRIVVVSEDGHRLQVLCNVC